MRYVEHLLPAAARRVALVLFAACSLFANAHAAGAAATTSAPAARAVRATYDGAATRIIVDANAPLAYSVRRPEARTVVLDLVGVDASALAPRYNFSSPLVAGLTVRRTATAKGESLTSLLVELRAPVRERSHISDNTLVLELSPEAEAKPAARAEGDSPAPLASDKPATPAAAAQATPTPDISSQGARYGQPGFVGEPVNLNVVNADIRDILNYITEQYGVNFVIDASVGNVPVTVNVTDVPWNIALDSILKANRLGIEVTGNILRVATTKVLADEAAVQSRIREARLDNSPLITEFIRLNYARAGNSLSQQAGTTGNFAGGTSQDSFSGGQGGGGTGDAGILPIIARRLSKRGAVEYDGRSNTLIVTDVRENIDSIRQLISLLDQPEPQVEIETRIVLANRNFSRDLGVQLAGAVFNPSRGGGIVGSTLPNLTSNVTGLQPNGTPVQIGGIVQPGGGLGATSPSTVIGLTTGIFGTAQISAAITAAEVKGQAKIIATPRVTALNNRPAQIESGSQIPVVTPQSGGAGSGGTLFTTTFISVPLRLSVTPQISDAGTVVLRIVAENNSVNLTLTNSLGTPGIDTQRMQTEVLVPDGGTTVVGGVLNDRESETQNRTPGLSGIPVIGNLFKRRATTRSTDEILFFITPRIYRPDYQGRRIDTGTSSGTRFVSIPQPVPLGNPQTNTPTTSTDPQQQQQQQQQQQNVPVLVPVPTTGAQTTPPTP
ncbi:MAG TPA: type IV pilus secretin PilQ [Pyrinomonadaceae bacterium]|nr:type IV pilus secretin PilQ [Pyrinomonadaceae bacterium]